MPLFVMLPISVADPSLPVVPLADIDYMSDYDPTSYDHWIFRTGDAQSLTGLNKAKTLALQGDAPGYGANYITLPSAAGDALLTDMQDNANATDTLCVVARFSAPANTGINVFAGNLNSTQGGAVFASGAEPGRAAYITERGAYSSTPLGATMTHDTWYFLAAARDFSSAQVLRGLVGGAAGVESNASAGAYAPADGPIGLGNVQFASNANNTIDVAEFIVYDRALSLPDLAAVYAASKQRMAAIGIPVV